MSSREKRLLILFAVAGFLVLNFLAFNFLTSTRARLETQRQDAHRKLDAAKMFRQSADRIIEEMEWLEGHEPEPVAAQDAQTRLEEICDREARSVGLTTTLKKPLETQAGEGNHYHRARFQFTVNGTEEALYSWLDRVNVPDQFRIATQLRLSPDKKDDTKIDCTATIEQWFVPCHHPHENTLPFSVFPVAAVSNRRALLLVTSVFIFITEAGADIPRKQPRSHYSKLWNDSPFTSKPVIESKQPEINVFEDYTLAGVSSIANGYRVTLLHKKEPDTRLYLESDGTNPDGFKILGVTKKPGDPLGTVVRLSRGTQTGIVSFDSKLLTLRTPSPVPQQGRNPQINRNNIDSINNPNRSGQSVPGQPQNGNVAPQRQPRPRIVAPPGATTPQPATGNAAPIQAVPPAATEPSQQQEHRREFRRRR